MKINNYIEISFIQENSKAVITNRQTQKTFVIGKKESMVLLLIEKGYTIDSICHKCDFFTKNQIQQLIEEFIRMGIIKSDLENRKINFLKLKFHLVNPSRIPQKLIHIYYYCFLFINMLLIFSAVVTGFSITVSDFLKDRIEFIQTFSVKNLQVIDLIALLLIVFISTIFHETGHMVTARHYNIPVTDMGIMLYWLIPTAYTNLTIINLCSSKRKKLSVMLAGIFSDLGIVGLSYILFINLPLRHYSCYFLFGALYNMVSILTNLLVFIKFDGYYILEILLDEEHLQSQSYMFLRGKFSVLKQKEISAKSVEIDSEQNAAPSFYYVFAVISFLYKPIMLISAVICLLQGVKL